MHLHGSLSSLTWILPSYSYKASKKHGYLKKKLPVWHCQSCPSIINCATNREFHIILACAALKIVFQRFLPHLAGYSVAPQSRPGRYRCSSDTKRGEIVPMSGQLKTLFIWHFSISEHFKVSIIRYFKLWAGFEEFLCPGSASNG